MAYGEVILGFDSVTFEYGPQKLILDEVSFSVRQGTKITLMGQNGSGKSTIFNLITKALEPDSGKVHIGQDVSIALAPQVISRDQMGLTMRDFFEKCLEAKTGKKTSWPSF